jgi:2-(1,2-epoxy-1,2-dihydrophenyl)acetyl-CoA isomerase
MNSSDSSAVLLVREGGIAYLVFNRPLTLNAIDVPWALDFLQACRTIAADPTVRVVVMRGEGRSFGVGGDLSVLQNTRGDAVLALIQPMHEAIKLLAALNAPVIASLHGMVAGGSMSLALACDLAIAAEGTRFNMAYANVAASSDVGGSWNLPRIVGLRNAMQIAMLSDTFDAAQALHLGIVNRVVPNDQLQAETQALAQRLAAGPTQAYGRIKRLLRQSFDTDFATQLDNEQHAFQTSTVTQDFKEAVQAFFAKRPAVFVGQ